jgi:hypothetical protein
MVHVVPEGHELSPLHEGAQKLSPWNWAQMFPLQSAFDRHSTHEPMDEPGPVPSDPASSNDDDPASPGASNVLPAAQPADHAAAPVAMSDTSSRTNQREGVFILTERCRSRFALIFIW